MRCCSFTTTICISPRTQIVNKKNHTQPIQTHQTLLQANLKSHHPRMLLQLQRNFSIARHRPGHPLDLAMAIRRLRIFGSILSSPSFGGESLSFSDVVGSGGCSSEYGSVLEVVLRLESILSCVLPNLDHSEFICLFLFLISRVSPQLTSAIYNV